MSERSSLGSIGLGLALAAGLVGAAWIAADAVVTVKRQGDRLEVKGFAERNLDSDYATWKGSFTSRAATLESAYGKLEANRTAVLAFLDAQGLPADARRLFPVDTSVLYGRDVRGHMTNAIEGYALSQLVEVASDDVALVESLSTAAADLIRQGIEFTSFRPEFLYTRLDELKIEMLAAATGDARLRAQALAESSGSHLGVLVSARQGVFQITPAHSTEVSDYGRNDTSTRAKSIKAVVTVQYAVGR